MNKLQSIVLAALLFLGSTLSAEESARTPYTFSDFFDALELPTMVGVGITPAGYEGTTFNTAFRLGWREGRTYGGFAYVEYDMHMAEYNALQLGELRIQNGDVTYNDLFLCGGYRLPLVKDLHAYYAKPYHNAVSLFVATGPGMSIPQIKAPFEQADGAISMQAIDNPMVPAWKFAAGVDWLVIEQLGLFFEASYTHHLKPTLIEQAAIERGDIKSASGPLMFSLGLCMFF